METILNKLSNFHLKEKGKNEIFNLITILCCFLFLYAGAIKLWNITQFQNTLEKFPLIGQYSKFFSYMIPETECLVCLLLIQHKTNKIGLQLFSGFIIISTFYIIYLFIRGGDLPCNCAGLFERLSWRQQAGVNILLICIAQLGTGLKSYKHKITELKYFI